MKAKVSFANVIGFRHICSASFSPVEVGPHQAKHVVADWVNPSVGVIKPGSDAR